MSRIGSNWARAAVRAHLRARVSANWRLRRRAWLCRNVLLGRIRALRCVCAEQDERLSPAQEHVHACACVRARARACVCMRGCLCADVRGRRGHVCTCPCGRVSKSNYSPPACLTLSPVCARPCCMPASLCTSRPFHPPYRVPTVCMPICLDMSIEHAAFEKRQPCMQIAPSRRSQPDRPISASTWRRARSGACSASRAAP
eukprot:6178877-Pleurochrysis_carterae.AAC.11